MGAWRLKNASQAGWKKIVADNKDDLNREIFVNPPAGKKENYAAENRRSNNKIIKLTMAFPPIGIVTYG